jgi:hypothetical protein
MPNDAYPSMPTKFSKVQDFRVSTFILFLGNHPNIVESSKSIISWSLMLSPISKFMAYAFLFTHLWCFLGFPKPLDPNSSWLRVKDLPDGAPLIRSPDNIPSIKLPSSTPPTNSETP